MTGRDKGRDRREGGREGEGWQNPGRLKEGEGRRERERERKRKRVRRE